MRVCCKPSVRTCEPKSVPSTTNAWLDMKKQRRGSIYACKKGWQLSLIHGVSEDMLWKWRGRDRWIPLVSFLDKNNTSNPWTHQTFWADILYCRLPTWISHQHISKSSKVTLAMYNSAYHGFYRSVHKLLSNCRMPASPRIPNLLVITGTALPHSKQGILQWLLPRWPEYHCHDLVLSYETW